MHQRQSRSRTGTHHILGKRMLAKASLDVEITAGLVNGQAPEWVELIPAGPKVTGRDGRSWVFDQGSAQLVTNAFVGRSIDLPIDWEHATQRRAPQGQDAPAAGWITVLQLRIGTLWGKVSWTPRGRAQVEAREYRYLSPVFDYETESRRIVALVSAGLANKPNLLLTALNNEQFGGSVERQATAMNAEEKRVAQMLGLSDLEFTNTRDGATETAGGAILSQLELGVIRALGVGQADYLKTKLESL
ncbi:MULTISPECIES: phage protease [unclassified Pseudomonas]|uniref:phage protease n=1 Tax=unclassified Pseudomonas TaxID=196821 RepID=UPI001D008387|nr:MULTISPECIES: phage protease [unclassified Pseudomonas]